jgi:hypothetical protein
MRPPYTSSVLTLPSPSLRVASPSTPSLRQVKRELRVLSNLRGGTNIIELLDVVRDPQSKTPAIVTEHVENLESKLLYPKFTDGDVVRLSHFSSSLSVASLLPIDIDARSSTRDALTHSATTLTNCSRRSTSATPRVYVFLPFFSIICVASFVKPFLN